MPTETPIAFCFFNRPDVTRRVFEAIRNAKPRRLLLIGDGPRANYADDYRLVSETRAVVEQVDWDCEVQTNYSEANLGCAKRMASGLTWAFEQSEELIVLEDDCLPDPSFFGYCESLLERYRDEEQVMMISGDNFQAQRWSENSYYFSRWPHIWGWASWRRTWQHFDLGIESWPSAKRNGSLKDAFSGPEEEVFWSQILDQVHRGEIDTWDYSLAYACWINKGLTILPETNLVSNLGFGDSATHTTDPMSRLANLQAHPIGELIHPSEVTVNRAADDYTWHNIIAPPSEPDLPKQKKKWYRRLFQKSA